MDTEVWRSIKNYEGIYEISSMGRVRRLPINITRKMRVRSGEIREVTQRVKGRVLSPGGKSYLFVQLCKNGEVTPKYIHHLVAEHFIGVRPKGYQVCHCDGDVKNSKVSNLRYDSPKGNASDRVKHKTDAMGSNNPMAVLQEAQVKEIKVLLRDRCSKEIARIYGVSVSAIKSIKNGYNWRHV